MQHSAVPNANWRVGIRRGKQGLHLRLGQIVDQPRIGSLGGDGAHPKCLFKTLRGLKLQIAKERTDGGKARVSRSRAVAATFLDVIEKRKHEFRAYVLYCEVGR